MQKYLKTGIALTALAAILSACGGNAGNAGNKGASAGTGDASNGKADVKGKIVFVNNRIDLTDKLKEIAAKFHEKYPNASVEIQTMKDLAPLKVRLTSGDAPDVMYNNVTTKDQLPQFFLPLDDLGFNKDNMLFYGTASYDGKVYGIDEGAYLTGVLYNKQVFKDAGIDAVPKTLDELFAALDKLKAKGVLPMGSMVKQIWPLTNWTTVAAAAANDPDFMNKTADSDAPFSLDTPYGKEFAFIKQFIDKGYMEKDMASSDWDVLRKEMGAGKVGMLMLANYGIGAIEGTDPANVGFFPLPIDNSGTPVTMLTNGFDIVVNKKTKYPEAAKAFVKYWLEESNYEDLIGILPSYSGKKSTNPQLAEFLASHPKQYPINPATDALSAVANKSQVQIFNVAAAAMLSSNDMQSVIDKFNKQWADARAAVK